MSIDRNRPPASGRRGLATTTILWLVAGIVLVGVVLAAVAFSAPKQNTDAVPLRPVERGPLTITVSEAGTIQNRQKRIIKSEVQGRATILWIVSEGTNVKEGDPLVELDSSELTDRKIEQDIRVQNAEASLIRAQENLAVTQSQAESDVEQATLNKEFAELDLRKYLEAEYPQSLKESDNAVEIAREELQRARDKAEWSKKLYEKKYVTKNEMDADTAAARKSELQLEIAQMKRDVLVNYTKPRDQRQKESDVKQKTAALERAVRKAKADVVQAEADLRAKQQEYDQQKSKLEQMIDQIAKCKIKAPVAGMVIYATTGQGGWRGNQEPLAEGQEIRERQEIIHLPTANEMMAEVKIHESALKKVSAGMPVRITTDALPGRTFMGKVAKIGLLPDAQMIWMNPDLKVYSTVVHIENGDEQLRAGMSCRAEIIVAHYEDAVFVPIQAVLRVAGKPTVYLWENGQAKPREIEIGLDNGSMIHVLSGLSAGEKVMLNPPLPPSSVSGKEEALPDDLKEAVQTAAAEKLKEDAKPKLSPEDAQMLTMLQNMKQRDSLGRLELDEPTMTKINAMLAQLDKGETVEIDPAVRAAVKAKMAQFRPRGDRRPREDRPAQ